MNQVYDSLKDHYIVRLEGVGDKSFIHGQVMNVINDVVEHYMKEEEQYSLFNNKKASVNNN